jgi:hypothetical protein
MNKQKHTQTSLETLGTKLERLGSKVEESTKQLGSIYPFGLPVHKCLDQPGQPKKLLVYSPRFSIDGSPIPLGVLRRNFGDMMNTLSGGYCRCLNLSTFIGGTRSKVEGGDRHDLEPEGTREDTRHKIYIGLGSQSSYPASCLE